jgi:toxin ParE1/3/4
MKHIRFSEEANRDIEDISAYIFGLNPTAAYRFLDALDETCELLAEHPGLGRVRADLGEGLRSFPVGNYLVFYTAASDGIVVFRLIYGGRDLPKVFYRP